MSSASPRVGLTIMGDSDFVDPGIVDKNSTQLDLITSVEQALSGVRPNPAFDGQHIYETDTKNFRRYDLASASWYLLGSGPTGSAAQGLINTFSNTSGATFAGTGIGNSQVVSLLDYNFTVEANRNYKIIEQGWFGASGSYNSTSVINYWAELYSTYNLGSQQPLSSTTALHYIKNYYMHLKMGARTPYYKAMQYTSGAAGNLFIRSCFRGFAVSGQNFGRAANAVGSYAWVFDMGPSGSSY